MWLIFNRFIKTYLQSTYESFTSAFCLQEKLAKVYADVGVMLVKSKPLTDLMADDVMTFLLDIFADIFTLET